MRLLRIGPDGEEDGLVGGGSGPDRSDELRKEVEGLQTRCLELEEALGLERAEAARREEGLRAERDSLRTQASALGREAESLRARARGLVQQKDREIEQLKARLQEAAAQRAGPATGDTPGPSPLPEAEEKQEDEDEEEHDGIPPLPRPKLAAAGRSILRRADSGVTHPVTVDFAAQEGLDSGYLPMRTFSMRRMPLPPSTLGHERAGSPEVQGSLPPGPDAAHVADEVPLGPGASSLSAGQLPGEDPLLRETSISPLTERPTASTSALSELDLGGREDVPAIPPPPPPAIAPAGPGASPPLGTAPLPEVDPRAPPLHQVAAHVALAKALRRQLAEQERVISFLQAELSDAEHTHELRDVATDVLKEELHESERRNLRAAVDVEYLKNVLVAGFESGQLSADSPLVPVFASILHLGACPLQVPLQSVSSPTFAESLMQGPGIWGASRQGEAGWGACPRPTGRSSSPSGRGWPRHPVARGAVHVHVSDGSNGW